MAARSFYMYILASRIGGTLYIGVTNDLVRRVAEHRLGQAKSFTKKYRSTDWYTSNNSTMPKTRSSEKSS
jgi:putative endonuclease